MSKNLYMEKIGKRAKIAEGVQKYGPLAVPVVGADILAQGTKGITGGELGLEAQERVTQQRNIGTLRFDEFRNGVKDGSIQEYQGKNFVPSMADTDIALLKC